MRYHSVQNLAFCSGKYYNNIHTVHTKFNFIYLSQEASLEPYHLYSAHFIPCIYLHYCVEKRWYVYYSWISHGFSGRYLSQGFGYLYTDGSVRRIPLSLNCLINNLDFSPVNSASTFISQIPASKQR